MKTKLFLLATVLFGFMSQAQVVHLTGNAVGGWNNPPLAQNLMTTTDNINYTLSNVQMTANEFKFMRDSNWGTTRGYYMNSTQWPSGSTSPLNCSDSGNGCDGNNIPAVAGLSRPSLYKAISEGAKPQFLTIAKVLKAVGGQITVKPIPAYKKKTIAQHGFSAIGI